jgi:acyl-coenzyme A synthetase/AMP-(fatty) acid ligase
MSGRFDLDTFCRLVEQHKPQRAHLVPPILVGLAKSPSVHNYDLTSLKMIMSAAAPLSSDVEETVKARLDCDVKQGWGMSELSPIGTLNSDFNAKPGSVGPLVPSTYGKIVDQAGHSLPANESGELLVKVRTNMYQIAYCLYDITHIQKKCCIFFLH